MKTPLSRAEKEKAAVEAEVEAQKEADRKKSRRQLEEEAARKRRLQLAAKHAPTSFNESDTHKKLIRVRLNID